MDVERCVRTLNEAWPRGDWDTVSACFHPDVVMLLPDSDELLRGRDDMLASYREFFDIATLHSLAIGEIEVFGHANAAVCHMHFTIDYAIEGEREQADGLEVYVLAKGQDGEARIVWRTQQLTGESPVVSVE